MLTMIHWTPVTDKNSFFPLRFDIVMIHLAQLDPLMNIQRIQGSIRELNPEVTVSYLTLQKNLPLTDILCLILDTVKGTFPWADVPGILKMFLKLIQDFDTLRISYYL